MKSCDKHVMCDCALKKQITDLEGVIEDCALVMRSAIKEVKYIQHLCTTQKESEFHHTLHVDIPSNLEQLLRNLSFMRSCSQHGKFGCLCDFKP